MLKCMCCLGLSRCTCVSCQRQSSQSLCTHSLSQLMVRTNDITPSPSHHQYTAISITLANHHRTAPSHITPSQHSITPPLHHHHTITTSEHHRSTPSHIAITHHTITWTKSIYIFCDCNRCCGGWSCWCDGQADTATAAVSSGHSRSCHHPLCKGTCDGDGDDNVAVMMAIWLMIVGSGGDGDDVVVMWW